MSSALESCDYQGDCAKQSLFKRAQFWHKTTANENIARPPLWLLGCREICLNISMSFGLVTLSNILFSGWNPQDKISYYMQHQTAVVTFVCSEELQQYNVY